MQVMVMLIVIGACEMIPKGLEELEIGGRIRIIQTAALPRSARILRRVLETRLDLQTLRHW